MTDKLKEQLIAFAEFEDTIPAGERMLSSARLRVQFYEQYLQGDDQWIAEEELEVNMAR